MKNLILLIIFTTLLLSCNQTKPKEEQSTKNEQVNDVIGKSVSLSIEPNIFKLSDLPETVKVTMTNYTNDTIITGLHYWIENYENNKWNVVSPDQSFEDLAYALIPSDFHVFNKKILANEIDYKVGKYRIVKYYTKSDNRKTKEDMNVYIGFELE